jgi:tRNA (cytidine/uridine-2'-O-)-methyltransferase
MNDLHIALYQPEIPGNTGAVLRLGACLGVAIDVIEPTGFDISDKNLKRAGMDYLEMAALRRHIDFRHFDAWRRKEGRRLVLLSTKAATSYLDFAFLPDDVLMLGRESAGVPDDVHALADARVLIPMVPGARSLNLSVSAAIVASEARRQLLLQEQSNTTHG